MVGPHDATIFFWADAEWIVIKYGSNSALTAIKPWDFLRINVSISLESSRPGLSHNGCKNSHLNPWSRKKIASWAVHGKI